MKNNLLYNLVNFLLVGLMDILAFLDVIPFFQKLNEYLILINPSLDTIAKIAALFTSGYIFFRLKKSKNISVNKNEIISHE